MDIIVSKFGGTSVGSADAFRAVGRITTLKKDRKIIVLSAVCGTTDQLLRSARRAEKGRDWKKITREIEKRHVDIVNELGIDLDLTMYFAELRSLLLDVETEKKLELSVRDHVLSFGERLSTLILEQFLIEKKVSVVRLNSRHLIKTDSSFSDAVLDIPETTRTFKEILIPTFKKYDKIIITGFIGANKKGNYTTFSRGGSDYSASIIAGMLEAKELEIWTDVDGIMAADPRIIPKAKVLRNVNYEEAAELSYFGAKVLHPKTIRPVVKKHIPVRVRNTFNPKDRGTLITKTSKEGAKSVARKTGSAIINLYATEMVESTSFMAKIFSIFETFKIAADVISTSEASVSLSVSQIPQPEFIQALKKNAKVEILNKKAIISIVGEKMDRDHGFLVKLFSAIKKFKIDIISRNSSERNITLAVNEADSEKMIKLIYKNLFE